MDHVHVETRSARMRIEIEEYVSKYKIKSHLKGEEKPFKFPPIPWKWMVSTDRGYLLTYGYCHTKEDAIRMSQEACKN